VVQEESDDEPDRLAAARAVVGVGAGVSPADYPLVEPLLAALPAELAATRKVTDAGWQPRSRQVGITGRSIAPEIYLALGVSGKANHMLGVQCARSVVAVNLDPAAPVFEAADVGIVADWRVVVRLLTDQLVRQPALFTGSSTDSAVAPRVSAGAGG
jgi:electron transfer flavoprotein alpha subunit